MANLFPSPRVRYCRYDEEPDVGLAKNKKKAGDTRGIRAENGSGGDGRPRYVLAVEDFSSPHQKVPGQVT